MWIHATWGPPLSPALNSSPVSFIFMKQSDLAFMWEVPNLQEGIKEMRKYVTVAGYGRTSVNEFDQGELHTVNYREDRQKSRHMDF